MPTGALGLKGETDRDTQGNANANPYSEIAERCTDPGADGNSQGYSRCK
jgi:hypothetical protein